MSQTQRVEVAGGTAIGITLTGATDVNGLLLDDSTASAASSVVSAAEPDTTLSVPALTYTGTAGAFATTIYGNVIPTDTTPVVASCQVLDVAATAVRLEEQIVVVANQRVTKRYTPNQPLRVTLSAYTVRGVLATNATATGTVTTTDQRGVQLDSGSLVYDLTSGSWVYDIPGAALPSGGNLHIALRMTDLGGNQIFGWDAAVRGTW